MTTPTLILWGEQDSRVRPEYGDWFEATLPNARHTTLPGVGHMPMQEAPEITPTVFRQFLAGLEQRR